MNVNKEGTKMEIKTRTLIQNVLLMGIKTRTLIKNVLKWE